MKTFKIRYNTEQKDGLLIWRVLQVNEDGSLSERQVDEINIMTHCVTTLDEIAPGVVKAHITVCAIKSVIYEVPRDPKRSHGPSKVVMNIW